MEAYGRRRRRSTPAVPRGGGARGAGGRQAPPRVHRRAGLRPPRHGEARRAAAARSCPASAAPRGWPAGLTGSMTHCDGYCAAALVRAADLASLGIDAEPHGPLPEGVLARVALPAEAERLRRLAGDEPRGPLGPAAVQRQGVRLQGVVPPHRQVAGLHRGGHRDPRRPPHSPPAALSAPDSSSPGRWWAASRLGHLRGPLDRPAAGWWRRRSPCPRLRRTAPSRVISTAPAGTSSAAAGRTPPRCPRGPRPPGPVPPRRGRRAGRPVVGRRRAGRSAGVEGGSDGVQQPQIGLDGGALAVGQYGGGHRSALPVSASCPRAGRRVTHPCGAHLQLAVHH